MIKSAILQIQLATGAVLACTVVSGMAAVGPAFPIKPSANGRYLVDSAGKPFFYHADTAWMLPRNASLAVAEEYLDQRVKDGFTAVHFHAFSKEEGPAKNVNGDDPFIPLDTIQKPNEPYWKHLDGVLEAAEKRGLLVSLSALWLRWGGDDKQGWRNQLTEDNAFGYGQFLGTRYTHHSNLVWIVGGDANPGEKRHALSRLALGIKDKAPHHLITVHNSPEHSSVAFFGREAWLDLNATYTYRDVTGPVLAEWNRPGTRRPIFLIESGYERDDFFGLGGAPLRMRRQAYGAVLSGALAGHAFGHRDVWKFSGNWREGIRDHGSRQMRHVRELFGTRAWWKLEPDQFHELINYDCCKPGEYDYVTAARATDGSFALAYLAKSRAFDVDMTRFPSPMTAAWYDPTDGGLKTIASAPVPNLGTRTFSPPKTNAAGDSDWVLVLEAASASANTAVPARSLASKYPLDAGIAKDPAVLFADNFETGEMKKWDEKRGRVVLSEDRPNAGRWCVQMPMERGKNTGGDAIKWFLPGADKVYARFYVRFSPDYQYNHHFVTLLANQRNNKWSAFGKAGDKPDGTYYSSGMEPAFAWGKNPPPGEVNLYSYFLDMEPDRKLNKYWGNAFFPPGPDKGRAAGTSRVIPPLDRWQCWEFMMQANSAPDKSDGKQALWVDGKLAGEFTGIRWRSDLDLKVNCLWLQHYGYDGGDPTRQFGKESQSVWFDDVVVATEYIGPIERRAP